MKLRRWSTAFQHKRRDTMESADTLPRLAHLSAEVLSTPSRVCSRGIMYCVLRMTCNTCASSSNALIVTEPCGFVSVRSLPDMDSSSGHCQTNGVPCRSKKTPPKPCPHASDAPNHVGSEGNSSERCVGRCSMFRRKDCQTWSVSRTAGVIRIRCGALGSAACSVENKPRDPGMPMVRLRRVPSRRSHDRSDVRWFASALRRRVSTRASRLGVISK